MPGTPTAPQYDNIKMGGPNTPRVPLEVGGGALLLRHYKSIDRGSGSSTATFNLVPYGNDTLGAAEANFIVVTNTGSGTGATVLVLPGAFPGLLYCVYNNTGQGKTVTLKVTGQTGVAVPDGSTALLMCGATDIQFAGSPVVAAGGGAANVTTYTGTTDAILFPNAINVAIITSTGPEAATLAVPAAADAGKQLIIVNTNTTQSTVTTTANKILNGTATPGDTLTAPAHAGAVVYLVATTGFWNLMPGGTGTWVLSEV